MLGPPWCEKEKGSGTVRPTTRSTLMGEEMCGQTVGKYMPYPGLDQGIYEKKQQFSPILL
jgi:hypothetical protein